MRYILVILIIGLFSPINFAQSAREDLEQLEQLYEGVDDIYLEMVSKTYNEEKLTIEQHSKVYKQGDYYLYLADQMSMLINKKYILMIDHQTYNLVCNKWTKEQAKNLRNKHVPKADDLLSNYPRVDYKGIKDGYKCYSFENDKNKISKIEIFFDVKSGFAKKTIYHRNPLLTNTPIRMELELRVIDVDPKLIKKRFAENQFIEEKEGKLKAVGKYTAYTVHDFRK